MAAPIIGSLRKFPYPFRNMLSILSDADECSKAEFEGMHKFMNTLADCGNLGHGVGLDIGDTFFMGTVGADDDRSHPVESDHNYWRYWWNDTKREIYAEEMIRYINSGWIDIPHTFFECQDGTRFNRNHVKAIVDEWQRIGFKPIAWVDHYVNPWNVAIGPGPAVGAVPSSPYYCVDLALKAGIKVFWIHMPESVVHETNRGRWGVNTTLLPATLPDDHTVWGLLRYYETGQTNNTYLGACIHRVLYGDKLSKGKPMSPDTYMIISTHFGYADKDELMDNKYKFEDHVYEFNGNKWFNNETIKAFHSLKKEQEKGRVLVVRTSRLIQYNLAHDMLSKYANTTNGYTVDTSNGYEKFIVHELHDDLFGAFIPKVDDLRGITCYCKNPDTAEIWIGHTRVNKTEIQINEKDHTGNKSIGIKWFKPDTNDYTKGRT